MYRTLRASPTVRTVGPFDTVGSYGQIVTSFRTVRATRNLSSEDRPFGSHPLFGDTVDPRSLIGQYHPARNRDSVEA